MMNSVRMLAILILFILQASCKKEIMLIETGSVSEVLSTTVYITGYLDSAGEGIKRYGHCISVNPNPLITDNKTEFISTIGTGEFTSVLYNLQPGAVYYARAYIASAGTVMYGNEIIFTTK